MLAEYFDVFRHFRKSVFDEAVNATELCEEDGEIEDFLLIVLHADLDGCDEVLAALGDVLRVDFHVGGELLDLTEEFPVAKRVDRFLFVVRIVGFENDIAVELRLKELLENSGNCKDDVLLV